MSDYLGPYIKHLASQVSGILLCPRIEILLADIEA